ncbi:MAG: L-lactate permease, partial [Silvibacterium sp.]
MPFAVRLKYLAPQVVLVGSRHPRLRRRVSPLLHYTIIGIALVYASIASVIGALGAFMTSSSTASNVLFGGLQSDVAHLHGLPVESIIAAQAAGSAYGNAIGPANVVLGTSITGIKGQEGAVLRQAMPWTILVAVLTGLATVALVLLN